MEDLYEIWDMDISVVIPALNAEKYLPILLRSIERQTFLPKEIIVVDSSSSSKTCDILSDWSGPIPIVLKKTDLAFPGKARNIGVKLAKYNWIGFIDCRTIPNKDWLENCAFLAKEKKADFVNSLFLCEARTHFQRILRAATYGCGQIKTMTGSLISKKAFKQSGGFQDVRAGEDIEWMDRIKKLGFKISTVTSPTINYQGLQKSILGVLKKSYIYAFANAYLEIRNNQKILYLLFVLSLSIAFVYNINWSIFRFAPWELTSSYFAPHVTKIYLIMICVTYLIFRGIIRPLNAKVKLSFLLPWRWLEVGFLGICIDIAKAPGLIWGAWLMINRKTRYTGALKFEVKNFIDSKAENIDIDVINGFGDEWQHFDRIDIPDYDQAFDDYFNIFPWHSIPTDAIGFDLGCGSGRWAKYFSKKVRTLHCIDASKEALEVARKNLMGVASYEFHHASVEDIPLQNNSADFGYSLGVLHHIPDTFAGLKACVSKLKPGAPFLLYLYYAFDNKPFWYKWLFMFTKPLRNLISKSPYTIRFVVCQALAITIYWPLSRFAAILEKCGGAVDSFPLAYYRNKSMYVLRTDALDRFGTRLEKRFTKVEIEKMMCSAGLKQVVFSNRPPYWVALGYKS